MDILRIAKQHIEDTLLKGFITLEGENGVTTRQVPVGQIIGLARGLIRDSITPEKGEEVKSSTPLEMFATVEFNESLEHTVERNESLNEAEQLQFSFVERGNA